MFCFQVNRFTKVEYISLTHFFSFLCSLGPERDLQNQQIWKVILSAVDTHGITVNIRSTMRAWVYLLCVHKWPIGDAVCATYFTVAVSWLVGEHVVVNLSDWRLPGDESAAVIHFTGCQVQGCIHGYRKDRGGKTFTLSAVGCKITDDSNIIYINRLMLKKHIVIVFSVNVLHNYNVAENLNVFVCLATFTKQDHFHLYSVERLTACMALKWRKLLIKMSHCYSFSGSPYM